ncbi:hypothetical protein OQJ19_11355 [Fluoribacter gormanii]|uniref:Substrate of the Dot/Icm secretion system, putative n=1 Tax=Fluoribacter gormanii TaxID=464 RepID=A0A377GMA8_9GAMM|nr:hypothetical protein [Fluoribacter gormanii]KTD04996.1 substrate of the Dot/Icm secretion system [Fluoribacter gormanii]MCW8442767.1 hypothetical protein [Fluoribacter gormanii]MCW8471241.1 hypothetical protein [Fluoribacter gormanii]SIR55587.1 Substrate of the Dot/Icm secretion system, putative [Fluoribacter gormanii]STO25625.1 Uncharacterised protein [Fluoribacter gormanii]
MTFVLKELSELRRHFDDTVQIILKREHKGKIEDLTNPQRKFELQFLSSILIQVEDQAKEKEKNHAAVVNLTNAFYGAMLTVIQDIENNRGMIESSGLLSARLKDAIGISDDVKAEDKPDLYQVSKFYTAINALLNQVFIGNDSRNGFAKNHMLTAVPTDSLDKLIQTSYKLEKDAQKAIVASFTNDGQTPVELNKFKSNRKSPASATDRFGGWDKLNAALDELIKDELADKNVSKIEKLKSPERIAQLHFLNAIRDALKISEVDEAEKVAILAGSMHLVRKQIDNEYASSYLSRSEKSVIFKGLNKILAVDEVNPQDVESLVTSTTQFMQFMTVAPKNNGKKAIRDNHIFSAIADFNLKGSFNLLIDMIYDCRIASLKGVVDEFKKETKKETKKSDKESKGYLGSFSSALNKTFFGSKVEDEEEEDDEEELEHTSPAIGKKG